MVDGQPHQSFPTAGPLCQRFNLNKAQLVEAVGNHSDLVYAYIMRSVVMDGNNLVQMGSGPNFQGGYVTLCTCKHRMRTSLTAEGWRGKWVAGFTSVKCGGRHWLFYLGRVQQAYESQSELWHHAGLPEETLQRKSARYHRLGDLYEPKGELDSAGRYDPEQYELPIRQHSHHRHSCDNNWRFDIDYRRKKLKVRAKKPAALLVCDPRLSFLWGQRGIYVHGRWRQTIYSTLNAFVDQLTEPKRRP